MYHTPAYGPIKLAYGQITVNGLSHCTFRVQRAHPSSKGQTPSDAADTRTDQFGYDTWPVFSAASPIARRNTQQTTFCQI